MQSLHQYNKMMREKEQYSVYSVKRDDMEEDNNNNMEEEQSAAPEPETETTQQDNLELDIVEELAMLEREVAAEEAEMKEAEDVLTLGLDSPATYQMPITYDKPSAYYTIGDVIHSLRCQVETDENERRHRQQEQRQQEAARARQQQAVRAQAQTAHQIERHTAFFRSNSLLTCTRYFE